MKIKSLSLILILLIPLFSVSQPCLPGGIVFSTQTEIDSFHINYPNCTVIDGTLTITGNGIYNLNGLIQLVAVNGSLVIDHVNSLVNLVGLNNITSIGGNLFIWSNAALSTLTGLDSLATIGAALSIESNDALVSLTGLEKLDSIGTWLDIYNNNSLTNLHGIDNIDPESIRDDLVIFHNDLLTTCEVASVCGYLADPNGGVNIHTNAQGCNSPEEVKEACLNGFHNDNLQSKISLFPNPANQVLFVTIPDKESLIKLIIFDEFGQIVLYSKKQNHFIDVSEFPTGIYYIEIVTRDSNFRKKLIIK